QEQAERPHVSQSPPGDKLLRKKTRPREEVAQRGEDLAIEVGEVVRGVQDKMPEGQLFGMVLLLATFVAIVVEKLRTTWTNRRRMLCNRKRWLCYRHLCLRLPREAGSIPDFGGFNTKMGSRL